MAVIFCYLERENMGRGRLLKEIWLKEMCLSSDFSFLISQEIISHILEAREETLSILKHTV